MFMRSSAGTGMPNGKTIVSVVAHGEGRIRENAGRAVIMFE